MRYGVSVNSIDDKLTFESLNSFSKFLQKEWKLSTSSIKEIVPLAKEVNEELRIRTKWNDKDWDITFFQHKKKQPKLREKKYADANFNKLEIRMHTYLPRIIEAFTSEKRRIDSSKKAMAEMYEKFKGFGPKPENINVGEMEGIDECISILEDYYANFELRLKRCAKPSKDEENESASE